MFCCMTDFFSYMIWKLYHFVFVFVYRYIDQTTKWRNLLWYQLRNYNIVLKHFNDMNKRKYWYGIPERRICCILLRRERFTSCTASISMYWEQKGMFCDINSCSIYSHFFMKNYSRKPCGNSVVSSWYDWHFSNDVVSKLTSQGCINCTSRHHFYAYWTN